MKKKTYMTPAVHIVEVHSETMIAFSKFEDTVSGDSGGWTKDSGDWDIWGNGSDNDDDYDDYDY